jgi:hypothetical protein
MLAGIRRVSLADPAELLGRGGRLCRHSGQINIQLVAPNAISVALQETSSAKLWIGVAFDHPIGAQG